MKMRAALVTLALAWMTGNVSAAEVRVAVAANFTAPFKDIAQAFERATGDKVIAAFGSTGGFAAQIRNGAPFDILLAADAATPARLEADKLGVAGSRYTYAIGRLVLWSADPHLVDHDGAVLRRAPFQTLAIADPALAPYGKAAVQTLDRLGLRAALQPKLVQGTSIGQTFQFVSSGAASLGFVALSQVVAANGWKTGSGWIVPDNLHDPIRQDALLLRTGADSKAAVALMTYLRGTEARGIIGKFGYGVP